MTETAKGSCLCGAVSYLIQGVPEKVLFCHCSLCRKQTGLYYASFSVPKETVDIRGTENIRWYEDVNKARRGFCSCCGSALFWKSSKPELEKFLEILAGSLDEPSSLRGTTHIFCASKGSFYELNDDLRKFDGPLISRAEEIS